MADIATVLQFFGALYLGAPFAGTYGESTYAALERRRQNWLEAAGEGAEEGARYTVAQNALDNLRIAIDAPVSRGHVRKLLLFATIHIVAGLMCASVGKVEVPSILALPLLLAVAVAFALVGGRGIVAVLTRERQAVAAIRGLELGLGA
jgi:hypothetical protein